MEKWAIFAKSMILAYFIDCFLIGNTLKPSLFVLCLLTYVVLNMGFYLIKHKTIRRVAALLLLAAITAASIAINPLFAMLLPAALLDLLDGLGIHPVVICALSLAPLLLGRAYIVQYLAADVFTLSLNMLASRSYLQIAAQSTAIDELKGKNYDLYSKLDRNKDFNEQTSYVSSLNERNKIAQELHDKIGHVISGSIIQLEAAKVLMGSDTARAGEMVGSVTDVLRSGMDDIRATLKNIKPPAEMLGFNRIKLLAGEFESTSGISVAATCSGDLNRITLAQWRLMMDNIGEALTNALKYSRATRIGISVTVLGKVVKCEVRDNGRGARLIIKGLGLAGMEERAQAAGGNVILDGSNGFSAITIIPIQ